ncbi:MAG: hypothetical protein RQ751_07280 [Longimicrobiales bacterium]|nr:hypothetical protein [Longimicrobiales bacterium]
MRWGSAALGGALALLSCASPARVGPQAPDPADPGGVWRAGPPLPAPVTNNAVAALETGNGVSVFSFLGLDRSRAWDGVTRAAYRWDVGDTAWQTLDPVPGPGRLAATAQSVGGRVYLLGGYTVAADGSERSVPDVNIFDPTTGSWSRGADIPVPADDAVSGVWRDSLIVLVSGWHDTANVRDVQVYDPARDRWTAGTPIPGVPVFGHTGAVVEDHVVYVDGTAVVPARPRFAIERSSWVGRLGAGGAPGPASAGLPIRWRRSEPHPGPPLYRAAGGEARGRALFVGGASNPYNYDGIGYDGVPAEPLRQVLAYDPVADRWSVLPPPPTATMDHRNAPVAGGRLFLVGGMRAGQVVSDEVWYAELGALLGGG